MNNEERRRYYARKRKVKRAKFKAYKHMAWIACRLSIIEEDETLVIIREAYHRYQK